MFLNRQASETQVTHLQRLWLYLVVVLTAVFLIAPSFVVVPLSFSGSERVEFPPPSLSLRWYEAYFTSEDWRRATFVSLKVAVLTVCIATPIGTAAAYSMQLRSVSERSLTYLVLILPMLIPLVMIAIGAFFLLARMGLLNTIFGLVLAHSALALPFVVVVVLNGFRVFDFNQELAARSLGASRGRAFLTVTLPQIRLSVLSAALLAFITSFDETVISFFISNGSTSTLTKQMFVSLRDALDPTIAAISTLLIGLAIVALLVSTWLGRESDRHG